MDQRRTATSSCSHVSTNIVRRATTTSRPRKGSFCHGARHHEFGTLHALVIIFHYCTRHPSHDVDGALLLLREFCLINSSFCCVFGNVLDTFIIRTCRKFKTCICIQSYTHFRNGSNLYRHSRNSCRTQFIGHLQVALTFKVPDSWRSTNFGLMQLSQFKLISSFALDLAPPGAVFATLYRQRFLGRLQDSSTRAAHDCVSQVHEVFHRNVSVPPSFG